MDQDKTRDVPELSHPSSTELENIHKPETALMNLLGYGSLNPISPLTQQTLIDVNSQPLVSLSTATNSAPTTTNTTIEDNTHIYSISDDSKDLNLHALDPSNPIITEFYERFSTGKIYQSLQDLRSAAFEYGRKYNIAITTSKSDKTKVYLICKHGGQYRPNANRKRAAALALRREEKSIKPRVRKSQKQGCCCLIYARCSKGTHWIIRKSMAQHNHPIAEDPRTYAMYRSLQPEHLLTVHKYLKENISISNIVKTLIESGVNNIKPKDIENIQQDLKRKEVKLQQEEEKQQEQLKQEMKELEE